MKKRYYLAMATDTATIRVSRETRDVLARQASERGISISAMLSDLAHKMNREAIFRAERDASRADAEISEARTEERDWEASLGDGIE